MQIKIDTFTTIGLNSYGEEIGTVQIEFNGKTYTAPARRSVEGQWKPGTVDAIGFIGRYRTGTKDWPCHTYQRPGADHPQMMFGRDERSGRCLQSCVRFDLETYLQKFVTTDKARALWGLAAAETEA